MSLPKKNIEFTNEHDFEHDLRGMFHFLNPDEIHHFLVQYPELMPDLIESHKEITNRFLNAKPTLEFVWDIEEPEWETLFIAIPSHYSYDEAFAKYSDLIRNWAFFKSKQFKQLVNFSFELTTNEVCS